MSSAQPLLSPIYDGPYRVLERSTHFFLLEIGDRTDKVSTLRLKAARYGASQAAVQGSPRCAGATCLHATADSAEAAMAGEVQPFTDSATNNIFIILSIRPPSSGFAAPGRQTDNL